jgi:uncharacterized protein YbbC (DUF1343 family)
MLSSDLVQVGCEVLCGDAPAWFASQRLGLLANQASVDRSFTPVSRLISLHGGHLTCLFSPQHGFHADKQANMQESEHSRDDALRIPIFSLYGAVREPSYEMLEKIDILLVDLQDVGTRVYTYSTTMGLCMEAAARLGVKVVVLDRPNPISGELFEGNILQKDHRSFVGRYPLPMRHGLTMGELARYLVARCNVGCDLEVIPMRGWRRKDFFSDTGLAWVFPSPNMPTWESALVYPGTVLLEGTNISEGRGTALPFQLFGAPFLDLNRLEADLGKAELEGVCFRPVCFEPVFDKWAGQACYGFQIHVTDRQAFRPYRLGLTLLQALAHTHKDDFKWLPPPYEYEWKKLPIDIILGDAALRQKLESGDAVQSLEAGWAEELEAYRKSVADCLLYQ